MKALEKKEFMIINWLKKTSRWNLWPIKSQTLKNKCECMVVTFWQLCSQVMKPNIISYLFGGFLLSEGEFSVLLLRLLYLLQCSEVNKAVSHLHHRIFSGPRLYLKNVPHLKYKKQQGSKINQTQKRLRIICLRCPRQLRCRCRTN